MTQIYSFCGLQVYVRVRVRGSGAISGHRLCVYDSYTGYTKSYDANLDSHFEVPRPLLYAIGCHMLMGHYMLIGRYILMERHMWRHMLIGCR